MCIRDRANSFPSFLVIVFYLNKHIQATNEDINRARLIILLLLALPCFSVDLKGISAIKIRKIKLFHVFSFCGQVRNIRNFKAISLLHPLNTWYTIWLIDNLFGLREK